LAVVVAPDPDAVEELEEPQPNKTPASTPARTNRERFANSFMNIEIRQGNGFEGE
jgi:hypothetical protein